jgi:hypothetical protein
MFSDDQLCENADRPLPKNRAKPAIESPPKTAYAEHRGTDTGTNC